MRQSGSLSQRRRCRNERLSVLRHAFTVAGSPPVCPGGRYWSALRVPPRRHVGADAHAVDDADGGPSGAPQPEEERVVARAAADGVEARSHPLGRRAARVGVAAVDRRRVGEVELQVGEARRRRGTGRPTRGARAPRAAWCRGCARRRPTRRSPSRRAGCRCRGGGRASRGGLPATAESVPRGTARSRCRGCAPRRRSTPPARRAGTGTCRSCRASRRWRPGSRRRAGTRRRASRRPAPGSIAGRLRSRRGSSGTRSTSPPGTAPPCARAGRAAELGRPRLEERGRIAFAVGERHRVQLAPLARLEHGAAEERLDPELDAVRSRRGPRRTRKVPSCSDPPRKPATSSAPGASRSAVTSSLRSSPSSAGAQSAWCMPIASDRTPVDARRVVVDAEGRHRGRRPRLVAVPEHAERLDQRVEPRHHRDRVDRRPVRRRGWPPTTSADPPTATTRRRSPPARRPARRCALVQPHARRR